MTDKRYFYRDPLAAAWMAKHFGMKITWKEHLGSPAESYGSYILILYSMMHLEEIREDLVDKYYIHPDDYHMLEPRVGDLLYLEDYFEHGRPCCTVLNIRLYDANGNKGPFYDYDEDDWLIEGSDKYKIIQRDGKPFIWPEVETV